ncbi:MAG: hypothetical protein B6242_00870 [Anaerolineaceae bacterium 4572_78]|nr:MAG: hypothetical protein B6242_00870 [Anaerolineaceae bacterium 4572_78]
MFTKIRFEHFKCFKKLQLQLAPLTMLSGTNATGKSTILQSFALLHQTIAENERSKSLLLNGDLATLGAASDVIDKITGRRDFMIGLDSDTVECTWTLHAEDHFALSVPIKNITWREADAWQIIKTDYLENDTALMQCLLPLELFNNATHAKPFTDTIARLTYISSDRIGPQETYSKGSSGRHITVGLRGERTPWFLEYFADEKPIPDLLRKDAPPQLQRQTEAWMRHFFPGTRFVIQAVRNANLVTMGIRTSDATDFHRPQNVGYGLTHTLPILAACLGAKMNDLILIENPESHLHPSGQAEMGEFLAKCASAGLQIILETHSDHILNGIRRAVKKQVIKPDEVALHFFQPRPDIKSHQNKSQVISPLIDIAGNLSEWPENFFDQFDKDTNFLIGWG